MGGANIQLKSSSAAITEILAHFIKVAAAALSLTVRESALVDQTRDSR